MHDMCDTREMCARLASLALLVIVAHQRVTIACATSGERQGQKPFAHGGE